MFQPLPRSIPFFGGPSLPVHLSSSSLACQVFSWILQLASTALASECILHPFSWHDQTIASFFFRSPSQDVFILFFFVLHLLVLWSMKTKSYSDGLIVAACISLCTRQRHLMIDSYVLTLPFRWGTQSLCSDVEFACQTRGFSTRDMWQPTCSCRCPFGQTPNYKPANEPLTLHLNYQQSGLKHTLAEQ